MKKIILPLCTLALMSACNENFVQNDTSSEDKEIMISTEVLSRAPVLDESGAGNFQSGDEIYLTAQGNSSGKWYAYNYTLGQSELFWNDLNMSEDNEVIFSACYPVPDNINNTNFSFDIINSPYKDLLIADKVNVKKGEPVNIGFKHSMHKLSIKYVSNDNSYSESDLKNIITSCKAMSVCNVDLKAAKVTEESASSLKEYGSFSGNAINFLVVPQKSTDVTLSINLNNGNIIKRTLSELCNNNLVTHLESGKELKLTFNITSSESGDNIQVLSNQISGWGEQGSIDDNIII